MTLGENLNKGMRWLVDSLVGGTDGGDEIDPTWFDQEENGREYPVNGVLAEKPRYVDNPRRDERNNNITSISKGYKGHEVKIIEPRSFGDTTQIVKQLLDQKTVVLNLHLLDKEQSQRTIDFVCGAAFAMGGSPQKVGDTVFIFTPNSVLLSNETKDMSSFGSESYWSSNLN